MPRGREIIGLPVFHSATGKRLGDVKDLVLDAHGRWVRGLVLDWGGWFHQPRVLPVEMIQDIGPDAIVSYEEPQAEIPGDTISERRNLQGKRVLSQSGQDLGTLDDVFFEVGGSITGFRLSSGFVDDLISGKQELPVSGARTVGQDSIIVESELS
jgi:uncharacterized protein YrrD